MSAGQHRRRGHAQREAIAGYTFMAPVLLLYGGFFVWPVIYAFLLSFQDYDLLGGFRGWVGVKNYVLLAGDSVFKRAVYNTVYYSMGVVPTQVALALIVAVILDMDLRGRTFFRVAYYLPTVTSSVVISMIFLQIYSNRGLFNYFLGLFHLPGHDWLNNVHTALPSIMAMNVWSTIGTLMVIYLSALQTIPEELYEASRVDGASAWVQFRRITIPLIIPTTFFAVVMSIIGTFQVFDQVFIMTNGDGGPLNSTMTLMLYLYKNAFGGYNRMGYAAAVAFFLFAVIMLLTLVQWTVYRRMEDRT